MVQNHLMQVVALIAMEPPYSLDSDAIKDKKAEVLRALRLDDNSSQSEIIDWVDKVVEEFCYNYHDKWDSFISVLMEGNDSDQSSEI